MMYDNLRKIVEDVLKDFPKFSIYDTFVLDDRKHISVDVGEIIRGKPAYLTIDPLAIEKTANDADNTVREEIKWQLERKKD